jgi:aminopeptidase N
LKEYSIDEDVFTSYFDGEKVNCFQFDESYRISTYLFCFVAGPYVCFESDKPEIKDYKVPMRIFCRKSIAKYVEKLKEDYFRVSKAGIDYYSKTFSTPYPF